MKKHGLPSIKIALFDFDGTLCRVNSYRALLSRLLLNPGLLAPKLLCGIACRRLGLVSSLTLKNLVLSRFRGQRRSEVEAFGRAFYTDRLKPFLLPRAIKELEKRRSDGHQLVVASGAFDFFLKPFCEEFEIHRYYGAKVAYDKDICLGKLAGSENLGYSKATCLRGNFDPSKVDFSSSYAYSDEISDLPMLNLVGRPFLVGTQARLRNPVPAKIRLLPDW